MTADVPQEQPSPTFELPRYEAEAGLKPVQDERDLN